MPNYFTPSRLRYPGVSQFNPNPEVQMPDIPRTLDGVFNAYMAQQQNARAAELQGLQMTGLREDQALKAAGQTAQFGAPVSSYSPADMQAATGTAPVDDRLARLREGLLKLGGRDPQSLAMQGLKTRGEEVGIEKDTQQARLYGAQADALGNPQGKTVPPPPGYRYIAGGNLEPIPGGPAYQKAESEQERAAKGADSVASKANRVISVIDEAIPQVGFWTAGFGAQTMAGVGGTPAANLKAQLDTIEANLSFDELQRMRDESKTGGALGQVAVRELDLLGSRVANVRQAQSPEQLKKNLLLVKESYEKVLSTMNQIRQQKGAGGAGDQAGGVQERTLRDGTKVRVRKNAQGQWEEV